jgi:hypothetical protein
MFYFLKNGRFPARLEDLSAAGLIKREDIAYPGELPMGIISRPMAAISWMMRGCKLRNAIPVFLDINSLNHILKVLKNTNARIVNRFSIMVTPTRIQSIV